MTGRGSRSTLAASRRLAGLGLFAAIIAACTRRAEPEPDETPPSADTPEPSAPASGAVRDAASLQALLDATAAAGSAPGWSAALADPSGVRFIAASGARAHGRPERADPHDLWHIGSCTKAMTAALYARLVDQGRARWGAKLAALFPDLASDIHPDWQDATIEALLSHTSGAREVGAPWLIARRADSRPLPEQRTDTVRDWIRRSPDGQPGKFAYSNVGYVMVGASIERITRQPWEDAVKTHVFDPLGMKDVGFGPPRGDNPVGHTSGLFGGLSPQPDLDNPAALAPAATVHLRLEEWARFLAVFIDPAQTFLSADSLARLVTPAAGQDYALGWGVGDHPRYGRMFQHAGSNTAWLAQAMLLPDHQAAVMTVCNRYHPPSIRASDRIATAIADGVVVDT